MITQDIKVNKRSRPCAREQKDVTNIDVGSLDTGEVDRRMRELYERTDEGWRCLVCNHTNKNPRSSSMRMHVETHMDGLVYTCNLCSKEFRSRNILKMHKSRNHRLN